MFVSLSGFEYLCFAINARRYWMLSVNPKTHRRACPYMYVGHHIVLFNTTLFYHVDVYNQRVYLNDSIYWLVWYKGNCLMPRLHCSKLNST